MKREMLCTGKPASLQYDVFVKDSCVLKGESAIAKSMYLNMSVVYSFCILQCTEAEVSLAK
jgi:hypothetical protein